MSRLAPKRAAAPAPQDDVLAAAYRKKVPATVDNPDIYRGARGGSFVASAKLDWLAAYAENLQTAKSPLGLLTRMAMAAE